MIDSYVRPAYTKIGTPVYSLPDMPARMPRLSARDAQAAKMREKYSTRPKRGGVTFKGRTLTVREWAKEVGISKSTLQDRLKTGWPLEKAFSPEMHQGVNGQRRVKALTVRVKHRKKTT